VFIFFLIGDLEYIRKVCLLLHADCPVMLVFARVHTRVLARYVWGRFMYDKVKVKFTL